MRLAVFASGNGSNFEAICQAIQEGRLAAEVACLIYDRQAAYVKERAAKYKIPAYYVNIRQYAAKEDYEQAILTHLANERVELIVLAGYMKIVGFSLLQAYPKRILNIHPSLLPQFPGKSGIADAFAAKVATTGVTVHLVDEGVDTGPILQQVAVPILAEDTLETLEIKIHAVEHQLYPAVIQHYMEQLRKGATT